MKKKEMTMKKGEATKWEREGGGKERENFSCHMEEVSSTREVS